MKRRANGEGTAPRRRTDRDGFFVVVSVPATGLGKSYRKTIYGKTERVCVANKNAFLAELARGRPQPGRAPTLAEFGRIFLDDYLVAQVQRGHNRESTRANYKDIWARHVEPELGHVRLDELTPLDLTRWTASLTRRQSAHRTKTLAPTTQLRIYGVLRAALNLGFKLGYIRDNPIDRVDPPRGGTPTLVPLEPTEITGLIQALAGTQLETLVAVMLLTGARPGEALAARWSDLDLDSATWHISRTLVRTRRSGTNKSALEFAPTKTRRSNAVIALPLSAVDALRQHRRQQAAARLAAETWADVDLVFTTPIGTPLEARNVRRSIKSAAVQAGITRSVRLHDLRHAAASALLAEGISMEIASKLLRHTRVDTTVNVYAHLTESVRREAAVAMDARFRRLHGGAHAP